MEDNIIYIMFFSFSIPNYYFYSETKTIQHNISEGKSVIICLMPTQTAKLSF